MSMSRSPCELCVYYMVFSHCTDIGCLCRCRFEYLWQDSDKYKRPTKMAAPNYIEHLMTWVQSHIDNEQVFPSRIGNFSLPPVPPPTSLISLTLLRRPLPQNLHTPNPASFQTPLPRIRTHLLPPLPCNWRIRPRSTLEYKL